MVNPPRKPATPASAAGKAVAKVPKNTRWPWYYAWISLKGKLVNIGVYKAWEETQRATSGVSGASCKGYTLKREATEAMEGLKRGVAPSSDLTAPRQEDLPSGGNSDTGAEGVALSEWDD